MPSKRIRLLFPEIIYKFEENLNYRICRSNVAPNCSTTICRQSQLHSTHCHYVIHPVLVRTHIAHVTFSYLTVSTRKLLATSGQTFSDLLTVHTISSTSESIAKKIKIFKFKKLNTMAARLIQKFVRILFIILITFKSLNHLEKSIVLCTYKKCLVIYSYEII